MSPALRFGRYGLRLLAFALAAGLTLAAPAVQAQGNAPTVSAAITLPGNGAVIAVPGTVQLAATASINRANWAILEVGFYSGGTLIGKSTSAPYGITWAGVPAGTYTVTAQAIATNPGQAKQTSASPNMPTTAGVSAPVTFRVNAPPTVSLAAPAAGSVFNPPASIAVTANAADSDGTVAKVDFYAGSTLIGTATSAPYSIAWANPAPGAYSLTAVATDNDGVSTRSAAVPIRVNAPPTVSLASPANNASVNAPGSFVLSANATDSDGSIAKVEFFQGTTLLAVVTGAPYAYTWSGIAAGNYSLSARATDNDGVATTSAVVSVNVNAPPTVALTAPANNAVISAPATITLTAVASDADGSIAKVEFYQGSTLVGTATAAPYSFALNNVAAGRYSYSAVATDNQGATTTSAAVTVIVNAPPTVALTSPANNAGYTAPAAITLTANAQDSDGSIAKVDYYQGATLIGTTTAAPYSYVWQNVAAGSYSLTVVATDDRGAATTSSAVSVRVNAPPTVAITAPANNAMYQAPASITLSAQASDADGSIARVDFYQGTSLIGGASAAPFSINWTGVAAGSYSVTAVATDNLGASTTSAAVRVSVNAAPAVTLTGPAGNARYTAPASITLTANAQDSDGSIARVEFLQGTTVLATVTAAPYTFAWTNVAQGTYVLSARATDNNGGSATSAAVTVTVNSGVAALYFVYPDHLNTPRLIADATGTAVWRWDQQEPFGNDVPNGDPGNMGTAFDFPLRFPGQYADRETGLAYNYYRDYDAAFGRYVQSDPIGLFGGVNTYAYVNGHPLNYVDVFGLSDVVIGVTRTETTSSSTMGTLTVSVNGQSKFQGYSLEPSGTNGPNRLREGTYQASVYSSPRLNGTDVLLLNGTNPMTYVEMHPGNFPRDTKGCVLPGTTQKKDYVGGSRDAFNRIMNIIKSTQQSDAARGDQTNVQVQVQ